MYIFDFPFISGDYLLLTIKRMAKKLTDKMFSKKIWSYISH